MIMRDTSRQGVKECLKRSLSTRPQLPSLDGTLTMTLSCGAFRGRGVYQLNIFVKPTAAAKKDKTGFIVSSASKLADMLDVHRQTVAPMVKRGCLARANLSQWWVWPRSLCRGCRRRASATTARS
jgi:hypothetical protein